MLAFNGRDMLCKGGCQVQLFLRLIPFMQPEFEPLSASTQYHHGLRTIP